jgi:cell wall-associated NlpC family hydrolase
MGLGVYGLRSRFLRVMLVAATIAIVAAAPVAAHDHLVVGDKGVVANTDGDGVNVRSGSSLETDIHLAVPEGTVVDVLAGPTTTSGDSWYEVRVNGTDGWVMGQYLARPVTTSGSRLVVVNTDGHGLRLRSDSSLGSSTLTVIPEGTVIDVVGDERRDGDGNSWANVSYGGHNGFAFRTYLAVSDGGSQTSAAAESEPAQSEPEPEPPAPPSTNGVQVGGNAEVFDTNNDGVNVRHGAGYSHGVAAVAAEGHVMRVLDGPVVDGNSTNWWNVDYRGTNGWVHGAYVRGTDREPTGAAPVADASSGTNISAAVPAAGTTNERIVSVAMQFLGYPYVWGGTTPAGFDCSGFLYYVVNQVVGGGFPRAMESQVVQGVHVPSDQLQPGDLVYQQNTYQWGLSHAGIYIGNGKFIHASTPTSGVIVSDLWDSYWGQRFYTARRIQ